ncbi:levanase [Rhodohalobacter mucosus]|uniref:Levanase n=2 Tax=Rhodohalobacter mucosus TaxID=2079485 RepID=A0A316TS85_9BACT|nr:levanase [Rhodohalobacter mucosus]
MLNKHHSRLLYILQSNNKKNICSAAFSMFLLLLICVLPSCSQMDDSEVGYDAELINQHLTADVTFEEKYRPQYHYSPKINWMNDPNGLVYHQGTWHLYHQYNPFGTRWGYMSWNHATSTDLIHWEHRPVAIPYGQDEEEGIFSGSAVVDHTNSSGFGDGNGAPIVAVYTSAYGGEEPYQAQSLAYSTDGGITFTKYEGNPVLTFEDPNFRDPNVKWDAVNERWLMVVALPLQHKVQFYASDNLIDWEYLSDFGPAGATGGIWECPDLFPLAVDGDPDRIKWVLHVDMNPGAIAGGSGSQFFVGDWDGTRFTADPEFSEEDVIWADYGTDYYAAISWNNVPEDDGRRIMIGWMNNWDYANEIPTSPWRSAMSLPRTVELNEKNGKVWIIQQPVAELEQLRSGTSRIGRVSLNSNIEDAEISGKSYELLMEIDPGNSTLAGIKVRSGNGEETIIGYDSSTETVYADRSISGDVTFHESFVRTSRAPARLIDGKVRLRIFVDWSSVEIFINDGESVITKRIFPEPESTGIRFFADGGEAKFTNIEFHEIKSIWDNQP